MNTQTPFDALLQQLTPEFVRDNIKKVADKFGMEVDISDEKIKDVLTKFQETAQKAEEMCQDAIAFKEELEKLMDNIRDGNGSFSAEYFHQAITDLEKRVQEAELKDTDRTILEGLISGAKSIAGFWVEKKSS